MNFLAFGLFFLIYSIIFIFILFLLYKFYLKDKFFNISKFTEKEIDKYFNAYDNESIESLNNLFKDFEDTKEEEEKKTTFPKKVI